MIGIILSDNKRYARRKIMKMEKNGAIGLITFAVLSLLRIILKH